MYCNSCVNPFIYNYASKDFRDASAIGSVFSILFRRLVAQCLESFVHRRIKRLDKLLVSLLVVERLPRRFPGRDVALGSEQQRRRRQHGGHQRRAGSDPSPRGHHCEVLQGTPLCGPPGDTTVWSARGHHCVVLQGTPLCGPLGDTTAWSSRGHHCVVLQGTPLCGPQGTPL